MKSAIETILSACDGVDVEEKIVSQGPFGGEYTTYTFRKVGDIKLPNDVFIKIIATATAGTVAKIVDIEIETYKECYPGQDNKNPDQLIIYAATLIYEVDGRKQKGRIKNNYVNVLTGQHETKYVRDVQTHEKVEVKNPVNKYKQEMRRGDWVIGVRRSHSLGIGRITRWTNSNVWGVTGDDLNDKSKEFQFASISETFTMPDDEHVKLLTMAVLKGWKGS